MRARRNRIAAAMRIRGNQKLVSILMLLIDVYAKPSACVAVDELDSGIFEFLLGELLQVLKEHGRGQLIFTAHNLRPLEILDKGSLYFTTTNPDNRYIKFRGSREKIISVISIYAQSILVGNRKPYMSRRIPSTSTAPSTMSGSPRRTELWRLPNR